jgi:UDP-3-O-[3-hydroxymyristoyl] glucosamine N-acyltransferase
VLDERFFTKLGPISIADLIMGLEATLPDPKFLDEMIECISELSHAKPGAVTFLSSRKALPALKSSKATACFTTEKLAGDVGARHIIPIISRTPRAHFARAALKLASKKSLAQETGAARIAKTASVHASAVIGAGAVIGEQVQIAPNVVIGPYVTIGAGSQIGPNVSLECAQIGTHCVIKAGAVIGGRGFGVDRDDSGLIDIPHFGRVLIGNHVSIGANSCIDRGQIGDTVLRDEVKIDNLVQIAHNVILGEGCMLAGHTGISGSCRIGNNVVMGGGVGLADHLVIGDNVQIAARSGVMHNIPSGEIWGGMPAQPIKEFMRVVAATRKLGKKPRRRSKSGAS